MGFSIFHLSDIHFKDGDNPVIDKMQGLLDVFNSIPIGSNLIFIIVSGDIAFSGKQSEYIIAFDFFANISQKLESMGKNVHFFMVPGNHDCDFSEDSLREDLIRGIDGEDIDRIKSDTIAHLVKPQVEFFNFLDILNPKITNICDHGLSYEYVVDFCGKSIRLIGLNSAWLSVLVETQGKLKFPISKLPKNYEGDQICITIMHHSFPWFESNNSVKLRKSIQSHSNLVLLGHQHISDAYQLNAITDSESMLVIEGGVLQERDIAGLSEFICLDINDNEYDFSRYGWNSEMNKYVRLIYRENMQLGRISKLMEKVFELSKETKDELDDPGTGFKHPRKRNLTLDDLFVYPNLSEEDIEKKKIRTIYGRDFWATLSKIKKFIIQGPEVSGKTSLAKVLFKEYYKSGKVPIILDGEDGFHFQKGKARRNIEDAILKQYLNKNFDDWERLERDRRIIIIDNFNRKIMNQAEYEDILVKFNEYSDNIVLFVDNVFKVVDSIQGKQANSILVDFKKFELKWFGPSLREEFIRKWVKVGQGFDLSIVEENFRVEYLESLVTETLSNDLVPHFPIFIGSILQFIDNQQQCVLSSFGQVYYELVRAKVFSENSKFTPDIKETILSEIAYSIFKKEKTCITSEELSEIHVELSRQSLIRIDFQEFLVECCENDLLKKIGPDWYFKYRYIFTYFVARYMQSGLMDTGKQEVVKHLLGKLLDNIHLEDCCNILMIYIYLTKDYSAINSIKMSAKSLFPEEKLLDIEIDVNELCKEVLVLPAISLSDDVATNRESLRKEFDRAEENEYQKGTTDHNGHPVVKSPREEVKEVMEITKAYKTMHILGQMLRSFPASLSGSSKIEIADEGITLGLRLMGYVFKIIKENKDGIEEDLRKFLESKRPDLTESERKIYLKSMVPMLGVFLCLSGIKRIGFSMGSPQLNSVYHEVSRKYALDSFEFVELVVQLEHLRPVLSNEIIALGKKYKHSKIHTYIGGQIVNDYLSYHELKLTRDEKANICNAYGISFQSKAFLHKEKEEMTQIVNKIKVPEIVRAYLSKTKRQIK